MPPEGRSRPHIMRMVVDLPAPFAPRKPKISPCSTSSVMPSTATEVAEALGEVAQLDRGRHQRAVARWSAASAWRSAALGGGALERRAQQAELRVETAPTRG